MNAALTGITNIFFESLGAENKSIHLDELKCKGTEQSLLECSHDPVGKNDCQHPEDVGVICQRKRGMSSMEVQAYFMGRS